MNRTLASCLAGTTGLAALAGAFVVGTTVAGPDGPPDRPRTPYAGAGTGTGLVPAAFTGTDLAAGDCDALLDHYVERGVDRVGPWGWDGPTVAMEAGAVADSAQGSDSAAASAPSTARQTNEASGTNVQESGVDEPDVVKTDGSLLVRVDGGDLTTYDVRGAEVERLASLDLPGIDAAEILLVDQVVVAIGPGTGSGEPTTRVALVDVSDPAAMRVVRTDDYDAELVTARLGDGVVRLVVQAGLPDLDFREPGRGLWGLLGSEDRTREANRDAVRASTLDDWLPHVSTDGGEPQPLLGCDQVGLPDSDAGLGTIAVVALDPARPDERTATGLATATDIAYASADRLYLAASPWSDPWSDPWSGPVDRSGSEVCCTDDLRSSAVPDTRTRLWSFALDGTTTRYVAEGEVDGEVRDRWSLDEAGGVLRVAVGPSWSGRGGDANAVVTMREEGDDLVEAGRVDGLGRGEQIQAVRWSDDLALVVTFRQVDPLYAVDLTDPDAPTLLGELKIPGFSSYLHPLGDRRLLGVGEGPSESATGSGAWGAQLGLFDVTDLTAPTRLGVTSYGGGSVALAGTDPRQLTWLPERRTVLTVVTDRRGAGFVSVVALGDGTMTDRRVDVGGDPYDVRLVPLPDGRVVLATASSASFLPL